MILRAISAKKPKKKVIKAPLSVVRCGWRGVRFTSGKIYQTLKFIGRQIRWILGLIVEGILETLGLVGDTVGPPVGKVVTMLLPPVMITGLKKVFNTRYRP